MNKNGIAASFEDRLDSLKESVRGLMDLSSAKLDDVKDYSRQGVSKLGGFIKAHPITALGIAFGIGFIAMRVMRR